MMTVVLESGISVQDIESKHQISLLILAIEGRARDTREAVSDLLHLGANPNISPEGQDSPLIKVVKQGQPDIADMLIKAGAKVNHIGEMGDAAVHVCCKQGL